MEVTASETKSEGLPKKDLLVWSGGLDSTAIFYQCFLDRKPIDIIYFDLRNNYYKGRQEIAARDRIKRILQFNFPEAADYLASIKDRIYEVKEIHPTSNGMVTYWQPFLWLTTVIQSIHTEVDYQNILMGYVQKDDFWHIRREFEAAYKNLQFMVNSHTAEYFNNYRDIKWPTLTYPFEWRDKQSIVDWLGNDKVGSLILKQIWFCEQAESYKFIPEPCGCCVPCTAWKKLSIPGFLPYSSDPDKFAKVELAEVQAFKVEASKDAIVEAIDTLPTVEIEKLSDRLSTFVKFGLHKKDEPAPATHHPMHYETWD